MSLLFPLFRLVGMYFTPLTGKDGWMGLPFPCRYECLDSILERILLHLLRIVLLSPCRLRFLDGIFLLYQVRLLLYWIALSLLIRLVRLNLLLFPQCS